MAPADLTIRTARRNHAASCAAIYAPYVRDTAVSFETEPPTPEEMAARIAGTLEHHTWIVAESRGAVVGYAYAHAFAERAAYRWACETSIYLDPAHQRGGIGRALYGELLPRLAARGYRRAVAGMTLPNDASAGLHRAVGFEPMGVYRRIGWKGDAWHDVEWMQRSLMEGTDPPAEPGS